MDAAASYFDNDGDVDLLVMNINEPPSLLRNDVTGNNHWLKVKPEGVKSNRGAIGARVVASYGSRKQAQSVLARMATCPRAIAGCTSAPAAKPPRA